MIKPARMLTRFLLCLFLILPVVLKARNDSWKEELKQKKTSNDKVDYLISYAWSHNMNQEALGPLEEAIKIARASRTDSIIAKATFQLAQFHDLNHNIQRSWELLQEARIVLLKTRNFNFLASIIYYQSTILTKTADPDSLIRFLDKNKPLIRLSRNRKSNNYLKQMYGYAYMLMNRGKEAEAIYLDMIPEAKSDKDTDLVITLYMNIGQLQPSFDSSMAWYRQVLDLTRSFDKTRYASLLRDIGAQYTLRDDTKKDSALFYFLEAEKNVQFMNDPLARLILYNWMGDFFFQKSEFRLALQYFRKSFQNMNLMEKPEPIPLNNLALVFSALKQLDSAEWYRKAFENAVISNGSDYERLLMYQLNATVAKASGDSCSLVALQNYEKAIGYSVKLSNVKSASEIITTTLMDCLTDNPGNKAISDISKSILRHCHALYKPVKEQGKLLMFSEFLERYALLEEIYGDKVHAFELYKELSQIQKEMHAKKYTDGLSEAVVKYKSELKDAEIQLLNEKDKASATQTRFILAGTAALACFFIWIFILYRRENKTKKTLDERNKKVEELLREIHHRVKNNLQIVSSFINIQIDRITDRESVQSLLDTSRRIMALASLHHSLYRQDNFAHIQMDDYITELGNSIRSTMPLVDVEIRYDLEKLQLNMDQAIPLGLSLNELLTNALKYAFATDQENAVINVSLHPLQGEWELIVRDNGKGLPEEEPASGNKSIGLRLVQNLVQRQVKGSFSKFNDNGAVFVIRFKALKLN